MRMARKGMSIKSWEVPTEAWKPICLGCLHGMTIWNLKYPIQPMRLMVIFLIWRTNWETTMDYLRSERRSLLMSFWRYKSKVNSCPTGQLLWSDLLRTSNYPWQVALQQGLLPLCLILQRWDKIKYDCWKVKNKQPEKCPLLTSIWKIAWKMSIIPLIPKIIVP